MLLLLLLPLLTPLNTLSKQVFSAHSTLGMPTFKDKSCTCEHRYLSVTLCAAGATVTFIVKPIPGLAALAISPGPG
jgi:hypothetical protein